VPGGGASQKQFLLPPEAQRRRKAQSGHRGAGREISHLREPEDHRDAAPASLLVLCEPEEGAAADAGAGASAGTEGKRDQNDGFPPPSPAVSQPGGGARGGAAGSGLGSGHNLHPAEGRVCVFGGGDGRVHPRDPGLGAVAVPGPPVCLGGIGDGA